VYLLTVHDLCHGLDKVVDDLESLSSSSPSLVLRETVQPLQDCLEVLLSDSLLYKFDYDALNKAARQQERTHLIVPA
jgi:hypothetical protein